MSKPHILVLGAGVIGLSTAFDLLSLPGQPYRVTILADEFTPSTTSGNYFDTNAWLNNRQISVDLSN
jgi:glycine/D-amino acid oxidase-like deaminating enzyme